MTTLIEQRNRIKEVSAELDKIREAKGYGFKNRSSSDKAYWDEWCSLNDVLVEAYTANGVDKLRSQLKDKYPDMSDARVQNLIDLALWCCDDVNCSLHDCFGSVHNTEYDPEFENPLQAYGRCFCDFKDEEELTKALNYIGTNDDGTVIWSIDDEWCTTDRCQCNSVAWCLLLATHKYWKPLDERLLVF